MTKPNRRSIEDRTLNRADLLRIADGTRRISEIADMLGLCRNVVAGDVNALRKQGHEVPMRTSPSSSDNGACVYRHFDADGRLLYVGACANPVQRTIGHASQSNWYDRIVRIEIARFANGEEAWAAEADAIRHERPLYNLQYNDSKKYLHPNQMRSKTPARAPEAAA